MKRYVLIVAGGKGVRMGGDLPKQFLPVCGEPVLMRTLRVFHDCDPQMHIVLALPQQQIDLWRELCDKAAFAVPHQVACGGETRFHSVRNALACVEDGALVGVHDGVRPFVSTQVIERCYQLAAQHGAVVPVVSPVETLRRVDGQDSVTVPRDDYRLVQTPQVFRSEVLKQAYMQPYAPAFTDDASVVEAMGLKVCLAEGNRENIKITTPFDLTVAEALVHAAHAAQQAQ